ncbi:MAG TPA: hypothetical protein PKE13_09175, partial [Hyphomicrobium zavarzinii]|nr:hypothetical protein [Hyphomicrobium zavarzinii]
GTDAAASGVAAIAIGQGAVATGSVAIGRVARASNGGAAFGDNSTATGANATAVGPGATATHSNSSAFGTGAQTTTFNEIVIGRGTETYTTPGITSALSKSRQTGPLEVVTSDKAGHLATDGGSIFERLDESESGIALAISMENPDLIAGEKFGIAFNAGFYEGAQALSFSAQGVMGYNVFTDGDRVTFSGGIGVGLENGRGSDVVGGRVGGQITWR